jgi:hypothetical protein
MCSDFSCGIANVLKTPRHTVCGVATQQWMIENFVPKQLKVEDVF